MDKNKQAADSEVGFAYEVVVREVDRCDEEIRRGEALEIQREMLDRMMW